MNWELHQFTGHGVVRLGEELSIQHAAEFYQALVPLADPELAVEVDASACRHLHTAIFQILHALGRTARSLHVVAASAEFADFEQRSGYAFARGQATPPPNS